MASPLLPRLLKTVLETAVESLIRISTKDHARRPYRVCVNIDDFARVWNVETVDVHDVTHCEIMHDRLGIVGE